MAGNPTADWAANQAWVDRYCGVRRVGSQSSPTITAWAKIRWATATASLAAPASILTTALKSNTTIGRKNFSTGWPSRLPETWVANMAARQHALELRDRQSSTT